MQVLPLLPENMRTILFLARPFKRGQFITSKRARGAIPSGRFVVVSLESCGHYQGTYASQLNRWHADAHMRDGEH